MLLSLRSIFSCATLAAAVTLSGCAVSYNNKNSTPVFSTDIASLLGREVDSADMPDGKSKVTLRELSNEWSLRFEFSSQVIPLGKNLRQGNIVRVDQLGNNITLLLRVQTPQCADQYRLVSIDSRKQAGWWEMACASDQAPNVLIQNQQQAIGFMHGDMLTTYIYQDGKLSRVRPTRITPSAPARAEPAAPAARTATPPARPRPAPRTTSQPTQRTETAPQPKPAPVQAPVAAPVIAPTPPAPAAPATRTPPPVQAPAPAAKPLPNITFSPEEEVKPSFKIEMK